MLLKCFSSRIPSGSIPFCVAWRLIQLVNAPNRHNLIRTSTIRSFATWNRTKMNSSGIIQIDGSLMEGGGQILRISVALSAILGQPIRIIKIRAGRSKPGLRPQHLTGVKLAADLCNAQLLGGEIGSSEIEFHPGRIRGGKYLADAKTAGSVVLMLQISLPIVLFADEPISIVFHGGTNADMAPQIDYFTNVFLPMIRRHCGLTSMDVGVHLVRRGFYPRGGGEVTLEARPCRHRPLSPIQLSQPSSPIVKISGISYATSNLNFNIARKMHDTAREELLRFNQSMNIKIDTVILGRPQAIGSGSGIVLNATSSSGDYVLGGSAIYNLSDKSNSPPERLGSMAADEILQAARVGATVDCWLQDQIIIFMSLAAGKSSYLARGPLTEHTRTAMYIVDEMTRSKVRFNVTNVSPPAFIQERQQNKDAKHGPQEEENDEEQEISRLLLVVECQGLGVH